MIRLMIAALAIMLVAPTGLAEADPSPNAEAVVAGAAKDISESDPDHLADAVLSNLDVSAISVFTLGRHARALDADTKARFTEAFEDYLREQITANADQLVGAEMTVTKTIQRNARDAIVTTLVRHAGEQITVRWRVIERGGEWSVVDLEFAGIWLAIEQRAQIAALLDRPDMDIDAVIERFH